MRATLILGAMAGLVLGCWRYDPDHCGSNLGDASCPEGMFCDGCEAENNGCVAEQPSLTCHIAGIDDDGGVDSSSTTSTTSPTAGSGMATTMGGTDPSGSSTAEPGCTSDGDCQDPSTPFCGPLGECVGCEGTSDPDGACAGLDAQVPVCADGVCVQCTADRLGACGGQTPVCGSNSQCVACTEHTECPMSACHLDGVEVGACFDPVDVVMVANTAELSDALATVGGPAVFVLAPGTYGVSVEVGQMSEVAILGADGPMPPLLSGNSPRAVEVFGEALVYLAGVRVSNFDGDGVACSGAAVWLDDALVRNSVQRGMNVYAGCAAHVRRTLVVGNDMGGIEASGGSLELVNSVVGLNGDALTSSVGGLRVDATDLAIRYSSVVGNQATTPARSSLFCVGGESGYVRNSILVSGGGSVEGCGAVDFTHDAVDGPGFGATNEDVGAVMAGWFVDLGMSDFHLTASGQAVFEGVAMWEPGDPLADVDGDPIPMGMPSAPGYDQP